MKVVASFKSKKQMASFDIQLRNKRVKTNITPTPSVIALGCGMSVEFDESELNTAKEIIFNGNYTAFDGFYLISDVDKRKSVKKLL